MGIVVISMLVTALSVHCAVAVAFSVTVSVSPTAYVAPSVSLEVVTSQPLNCLPSGAVKPHSGSS